MAEAVIEIGRSRSDPDSVERDQRGEQIEPGIGERAEHRDRAGGPGRIALENQQEERGGDAGQRRPGGQRAMRLMAWTGSAHG